jgi:ABC-type Fe3+/spermidine/putrescine transport system ATPase subunit
MNNRRYTSTVNNGSGSAPNEPQVELVEISKNYRDVVAVDGISMQVFRNEFVSILGPSGCGKTTTLRMIAGLEKPTSGEVWIEGTCCNDLPANARPTNMVFQNYALFPHMTVFQNVAYGLTLRNLDRPDIVGKVEETIQLVQLSRFAERYPHELSGGEQQRVALARALACDPAVLLLDEPLGSLDLKLRKEMQVELKKVQERVRITFIYVTHDQEEALALSDRIVVMSKGRIVQEGESQELYEKPATKFVAEFVGENNVLPCNLVRRDRNLCTIEIGESEMRACLDPGVQTDQDLYACIPANRIALGVAAADCDTKFDAQLYESIYRGMDVKWVAELVSGHMITISVPAKEHDESLCPGDVVSVGWKVDDIRLVPE